MNTPTIDEAVSKLKQSPVEPYLEKFFHRGAREFVTLDPQDPISAIELAWLASHNDPTNPIFHFELIDTGLVKVWQYKEWLKASERREIIKAEMEVIKADLAVKAVQEKKVRAAYDKMYGVTRGPIEFAKMMNGDNDIPGERPMREKFGL